MNNIMTEQYGTEEKFPTPQEIAKARKLALEPDIRHAKMKIKAALMDNKKSVAWDFRQSVFEEVKAELALSGWILTYHPGGTLSNTTTVSIEIADKGQR
jgi:hypothetical protein